MTEYIKLSPITKEVSEASSYSKWLSSDKDYFLTGNATFKQK